MHRQSEAAGKQAPAAQQAKSGDQQGEALPQQNGDLSAQPSQGEAAEAAASEAAQADEQADAIAADPEATQPGQEDAAADGDKPEAELGAKTQPEPAAEGEQAHGEGAGAAVPARKGGKRHRRKSEKAKVRASLMPHMCHGQPITCEWGVRCPATASSRSA